MTVNSSGAHRLQPPGFALGVETGSSRRQNPGDQTFRRTVAIQTQGCKLNQADSDQLARHFTEAGFTMVDLAGGADVIVVNTCTVTAAADAKARQALRSARRANPNALVVATGCYPQRAAKELELLEAVDLVAGNTQKEALAALVAAALDGRAPPVSLPETDAGAASIRVTRPPARERVRAMVKIQEGCDQVCAYCIVPKVRGRERSIHPDALVEQINLRVNQGCQEVVLTGTQLGTYGFDLTGINLVGLIRRLLADTGVPRLRVSSLQPQEITGELLDLWQDQRLCPHFHIPLQSGSDPVLAAMRRRYTTAQFAGAVELVRRAIPGAGVTADVIVGFPGEGDNEFRDSLSFAQAMQFSDMHVFPYSRRPGTSAVYLGGQVAEQAKKDRSAQMIAMASDGFSGFRSSQLGLTRRILWETQRQRDGALIWSGLTDNYIRVYTNNPGKLANTITQAQLVELDGDQVAARVV